MITPTALIALAALQAAGQAQGDYFQQGVDYRIEASLDESTDVLSARARMGYTNNSPARIDTLYFHLSLNAFRPNSAWARRDLQFDERRFQDLGPDEHAFLRLDRVTVGGADIAPIFIGAPDSTVVAVPLATPLEPGGNTSVLLDWRARLSTLPRRQGRDGRRYDFAQWYPRIAVHDRGGWRTRPLLPQGEFYGEFATYDVTLELATDQIIGATGVPVEGDPGWRARPGDPEPTLLRDAYDAGAAEPLGLLDGAAGIGRKQVRWFAEDVHHFAWSVNPEYIYEGGSYEDVRIHVLYQPGDEREWGDGIALRRTASALAFLDDVFGDYAWPQLTNLHRIEGGGTEFPMVIMDGSASEGLIVHESAHQYVHGILANNEWLEGWLDEGFASFLGNWYQEEAGADGSAVWGQSVTGVAETDAAGLGQPVGLASADYRDYSTYGAMTYTKGSVVLRMARYLLGEDAFRRALRAYYAQHQLQHVNGQDFEIALEAEYSGGELDWFFEQWIATSATLDYAVAAAGATRTSDGWETRVVVTRSGNAWMPVDLRVGDTVRRLESRDRSFEVTVRTSGRPDRVVLDPEMYIVDADRSNNARAVDVQGGT